jgi:hypothetical protein
MPSRCLVTLSALFIGCNMVTGASDIVLSGSGGAGGSASTASSSGAVTGAGGATNGNASAASSGAQSAASSTVASSSSGSNCVYPAGPYNVTQGAILPPTLHWSGYPAGGFDQGTVSVKDLYDCDGSKGITALFFDTSQFG